ncbi:hypothetical protein V501_03364 [Pseudogymnoascus sp. VKM F-4519 (FW-2642)]|nr:hypothetical protein V501_03364 [Pseudogymnoascus sp. VKM F-4519 (FW-2642)]
MSKTPIYLISVNKTPERAALLVGQLLDSLDNNNHGIVHIANASTLQELEVVVDTLVYPPGILICSSQWTAEEQDQAVTIAKASLPDIGVITIPPGLDVREGSEGILSFLKGAIQNLEVADDSK